MHWWGWEMFDDNSINRDSLASPSRLESVRAELQRLQNMKSIRMVRKYRDRQGKARVVQGSSMWNHSLHKLYESTCVLFSFLGSL